MTSTGVETRAGLQLFGYGIVLQQSSQIELALGTDAKEFQAVRTLLTECDDERFPCATFDYRSRPLVGQCAGIEPDRPTGIFGIARRERREKFSVGYDVTFRRVEHE